MAVFRVAIAPAAIALALVITSSASPEARFTCPVTIPTREVTPGFAQAGFNYGGRRLRAHLSWPRGHLPSGELPGGGSYATIGRDGTISTKIGWWREGAGRLVITGRRLDARAPPLRSHVPSGYGPGFQPAGLLFPTVGCWRVVGRVGPARLAFVVKVIELRSG